MDKKYVYVLIEDSSWDYEYSQDIKVYSNFNDALKDYNQRVKDAKNDMDQWLDKDEQATEELVDTDKEYASFSIYEDGNWTRTHDDISVNKKEVM